MFSAMKARLFGAHPQVDGPPVVIGATGGSGTRALHEIMTSTGHFMGTHLNSAGDAMAFTTYLDRMINRLVVPSRSLDYDLEAVASGLRKSATDGLRRTAALHLAKYEGGPWGWKNPRAMYILPVIEAVYPGFRFVHVIRDGRDMAFSNNQNQLRKHYEALFGVSPAKTPSPLESVRVWDLANRTAADWAERWLGARYVRLRYEDLCADPQGAVAMLFDRLGLATERLDAAAACVGQSRSIGRWRERPAEQTAALSSAAAGGLARFGYATEAG